MRRAELWAVLAVAAAGCMRVYPDPERPDVVVAWDVFEDCGKTTAVVSLVDVDDDTKRFEATAACSTSTLTFADVPYGRYQMTGELRDVDQVRVGTASFEVEIDLRDGLDEEAYLSFFPITNLAVEWTFPPAQSCESLRADLVELQFVRGDEPPVVMEFPCEVLAHVGFLPAGEYAARVRAFEAEVVVATSAGVSITVLPNDLDFANFEYVKLPLVPCESGCP